MKRTKSKKEVSTILCSDIHLRLDQPICRTDNFVEAQTHKLEFLSQLQKQYNCPVLHAGDLFHHWKPSPELLSYALQYLPEDFYTVYGQHDLPQHNFELRHKSGINVLEKAGKVSNKSYYGLIHVKTCNWNSHPLKDDTEQILLWHTMVWHEDNPYHTDKVDSAKSLLKKYPNFDLIVTGDNHKPFVVEYQGRLLVNPGSFTRQRASETHKPQVYLYYGDDNTVEEVILPHDPKVISREHIERTEQRDKRIEDFISRLNTEQETLLSFEDNIKLFLADNPDIRESVQQLIYKSINQ